MDEEPEVRDQPGPWDEIVNRLILLAPWVAIALVGGWLFTSGTVTTDITIDGTISATPIIYGMAALIGGTYLLALMKFYGTSPVAWVAEAAANYNPGDGDD